VARRLNHSRISQLQKARASLRAEHQTQALVNRLERAYSSVANPPRKRWEKYRREDPSQVFKDLAKHRWQVLTLSITCRACGHKGTASVRRRQLPKLKCSACGAKRFAARPL
jgi:hypothetical protein